jgi:hypothetical protein
MTRRSVTGLLGLLMATTLAGCASGPNTPTPLPPAPPAPSVSLEGFWQGVVGPRVDDGRTLGVTWLAEESASGFSGQALLSTSPSAPAQVTFVGTFVAVRNDDEFSLTYLAQPARFTAGECGAFGRGRAHVEGDRLIGELQVGYLLGCELGLQPPASIELALERIPAAGAAAGGS